MSLSDISIRRPVFAWMLMIAIILFGVISFRRLGVSRLPDVDFPMIYISVGLPGAAPEVMEQQVIDPIEDAIMGMDGILNVNSSASQSSGSISVEFELDRNVDKSMQEIQSKINQVRNLLPAEMTPPILRKINPENQPILWLTLTSSDPQEKLINLMSYTRDVLYDQFTTIPGVGNVSLGGWVYPALRVWVDINKINKFELTSNDLIQSILDGHTEVPMGRFENKEKEYNLRLMGEALSPEEFGRIMINTRSSIGPTTKTVRLNDVASIEEGTLDIRKLSRFNGKRTTSLGIIKQQGANAVEVAKAVREKLDHIKSTLPSRYELNIRADMTKYIQQSVDELLRVLFWSVILTSLVCYLFLGSWGSTINILMAIPTSIIGSFIVFYFFNFTLNTFTLLGLSLAIGIVVDDSIMMLENIVRHQALGEGRKTAAIKGANEISFAAIASTVAVVAIFLPVVFMKGIIGRYLLQYGVTVTVAVLLSLLEALTLTPMRCSQYLNYNAHPRGLAGFVERNFEKLSLVYRSLLKVLLDHRWITLGVALSLFTGSFFLVRFIKSEMIPAQDQAVILYRFKLPMGTAFPVTSGKMAQVEEYLAAQSEVTGVFALVGGFGGDAINQGIAFVTLVDKNQRKDSQSDLIKKFREELRHRVSGMEIIAQDLSMQGPSAGRGFPVEFILQGPDWQKLKEVSAKVVSSLNKTEFVTEVNTDIQEGNVEVQIVPNRTKLAQAGVSMSTVTSVVNALVGGMVLNGSTLYPKGGHRYSILLRLYENQRQSVEALKKINIRNNRGGVIPLKDLVDIQFNPALSTISRLNRFRSIKVYGNLGDRVSQKEAMDKTEKLAKSLLPAGYSFRVTGASQSFKESMQSLLFAMGLGFLVSYMVLASQFNSFIHPVTILIALPFSISGAFLGLLAFQQSINIYSMIGFILLMGIVKKNSILLVDYANQKRSQGYKVREALLEACPVRFRPIIMTSVATVVGALPEVLSRGQGAETMIPMAAAIIGGVMVSTLLTLLVVPCVYSLLSRWERTEYAVV